MKDVVKLSEAGGTLGFPIKRSILKALDLKWKDPVEFDFFDDDGNVLVTVQGELKKNKRVTIRDYIAEEYNLKVNQVIQVDVRLPKEIKD